VGRTPDELGIIESIVGKAGRVPRGYTIIGDDVAVFPVRAGKLVAKVDMLVEGTDVPRGMTYRQAARKAVAMCVSDFAAKGVKPDSFLVSLGLRNGVTQGQADEVAQGLRDAEREWGAHLVGGDTNESSELIIDCAMFGFARKMVTRSGASSGDVVVVTGSFGCQPAGLKILMQGASADSEFAEKARKSVLLPTPSLEVGLALAPFLTSAMDSSDGLARSLHTLAKESGVGFEVTVLPVGPGVDKFARANGLDTERLVLEGGEEYVIVGTVKGSRFPSAAKAVRKAGGELIEIGKATSSKGRVELRVGRSKKTIRDEGWTHLR
jgi:thiamine-monophosphate kinase